MSLPSRTTPIIEDHLDRSEPAIEIPSGLADDLADSGQLVLSRLLLLNDQVSILAVLVDLTRCVLKVASVKPVKIGDLLHGRRVSADLDWCVVVGGHACQVYGRQANLHRV